MREPLLPRQAELFVALENELNRLNNENKILALQNEDLRRARDAMVTRPSEWHRRLMQYLPWLRNTP